MDFHDGNFFFLLLLLFFFFSVFFFLLLAFVSVERNVPAILDPARIERDF